MHFCGPGLYGDQNGSFQDYSYLEVLELGNVVLPKGSLNLQTDQQQ